MIVVGAMVMVVVVYNHLGVAVDAIVAPIAESTVHMLAGHRHSEIQCCHSHRIESIDQYYHHGDRIKDCHSLDA